MRIFKSLLAGGIAFFAISSAFGSDSQNLLRNTDLKDGKNGKPDGWTFSSNLADCGGDWTEDGSRDGNKVLKVAVRKLEKPQVSYSGAQWKSDIIPVTPGHQLEISGWMKGENIVPGMQSYFKMRVGCLFLDSSKTRMSHKDIALMDGSFDWKRFSGVLPVPENAMYAVMSCGLTACTGTVYFSGMGITKKVSDPTSEMSITPIEGPIVIPKPWKAAYGKTLSAPSSAILNIGADEPASIKSELIAALKKAGVSIAAPEKGKDALTVSVLASPDSVDEPELKKRLLETWSALPSDGYLVEVVDSPSPKAYLIGKTPAARYYALQTFKCMLLDNGRIWSGSIADYPELALRGMPMGVQWWWKLDETLSRLSALKCNYIYFKGSNLPKFGSDSHRSKWREPFNDDDIRTLKTFLGKCRARFIEPCLDFSPRGNPPVVYCSDAESQIIIDKIKILHAAGFRNFAISFDDLQNIGQDGLSTEEDRKVYHDIGDAHLSFVARIYEGISKLEGITFTALPLWYGAFETLTDRQMEYMEKFSHLPPEIDMMYCESRLSGLLAFRKFMKRKNPPLIWDNFYATWSDVGVKMTFAPPIDRSKDYSKGNAGGYACLPAIPKYEDIGLSSWNTMADYMWAPSRYEPKEALNRAVVKRLGREESAQKFIDYAAFMRKTVDFKPDTKDKESRIRSIKAMVAEFKAWRDRLSDVPDKAMKESIDGEIARRLSDMDELLAAMDGKDFPFVVQRTTTAPALDGDIDGDPAWKDVPAKTGFLNVKNGKLAERQTSFKMCHNDKNLYIAISCMEDQPEKMIAKIKDRDRNVFQDDSIELFLDTKQSGEAYFHIVINSIGAVYDSNRIKKVWFMAEEKEWTANMTAATKKFSDKWTVEIALPMNEFGGAPGARWNFNIGRERQIDPKECSTYARLLKNGFHDPARFWTLEFAK